MQSGKLVPEGTPTFRYTHIFDDIFDIDISKEKKILIVQNYKKKSLTSLM
jgi:hypothetical protein